MKRILLIVIYCIALSTLVACGNNPDRVRFSDNNSTIHYGGTVYHEFYDNGDTGYYIIDESPIKVGSFFSSLQFGFIPVYVSDFDVDKNILFANIWMWTKEGFEFPDYFSCKLNEVDVWIRYTDSTSISFVSTLWEDEEEYLTLDDIIDTSDPMDGLTGKSEYFLRCFLMDYPYLRMGGVDVLIKDSDVYLSLWFDFEEVFYKVREEYVPMFDF